MQTFSFLPFKLLKINATKYDINIVFIHINFNLKVVEIIYNITFKIIYVYNFNGKKTLQISFLEQF